MPVLYIVGGGLFAPGGGALKGIEAVVFDPGISGAASHAAAGLFKEAWAGKKLHEHYQQALPILEKLYGIRSINLTRDDGGIESFLCVPPTKILEANPVRETVTAVGDGWLEAGAKRYEGWIFVAAGVWSGAFLPGLDILGKAGSSFVFAGERPARIREIAHGRQSIAFARDPGSTFFSDGTAEINHANEHDRLSLERAAGLGLVETPIKRHRAGDRIRVGAAISAQNRRGWRPAGAGDSWCVIRSIS